MAREQVIDALVGIVFGGVAITTAALQHASDGDELTFTQWRAILFVGEAKDGCRVGEVANLLDAGLPATSRLLRRLERRELLTIERDVQDRRASRARLTAAGSVLRKAVLDYRRNEIGRLVDKVQPGKAVDESLKLLSAAFDARGRAGAAATRKTGDPVAS
jgi:DNA-binding MarR family transcriptional regulator